MKKTIILEDEYMTLGQLLKEISEISSGGEAKYYLKDRAVFVDGEVENRRGRKLYPNMMVEIPDKGTFFVVKKENSDDPE